MGIIHLKILKFSNVQKFGALLFQFSKIFKKPSSNFKCSKFACRESYFSIIFSVKTLHILTTFLASGIQNANAGVHCFKHLNNEILNWKKAFSKFWNIGRAIFQIFGDWKTRRFSNEFSHGRFTVSAVSCLLSAQPPAFGRSVLSSALEHASFCWSLPQYVQALACRLAMMTCVNR